jgi:hypothetical protein
LQPHRNCTLPVFLQLFFCNRSHMLFFCNCFFCKSHCDKVAITNMLVFSNNFFAITSHQWLQPHCNLFCNHPYFHQVATQ